VLEKLFERIATALQEAAIRYMIIGGQAVLLYGEPRLTKDVDITLGIGLDRLSDLLAASLAAGLKPLVDPETFTRETLVLPCSDPESGLRVDFILSFSPFEQLALSRARIVRIGNVDLRFASLEDLVIHKLFAGRARDLEDVKNILLKNPVADISYIRHWLNEFSDATGEAYVERLEQILNDVA
jgi:predicted nucleotidyltransferase